MSTTFENAVRGLREVRASQEDERLVALLAAHARDEEKALASYRRFAEEAPSSAARYLVTLVLDDERRHHRILEEIANAVAWGPIPSPDPAVPSLSAAGRGNTEFEQHTRELLDIEERDLSELTRLRKTLRPYADTTLWGLLVEIMIADTEKHARILRFILKQIT